MIRRAHATFRDYHEELEDLCRSGQGRGERRTFIAMLAGGMLAAPLAAEAQQVGKVWRVSYLDDVSSRDVPWFTAFERRLVDLGYIEGENLALEFRTARGRPERLPELASEIVRARPDVIAYVGGPDGARALKQATRMIPIVASAIEWDPVSVGVASSDRAVT